MFDRVKLFSMCRDLYKWEKNILLCLVIGLFHTESTFENKNVWLLKLADIWNRINYASSLEFILTKRERNVVRDDIIDQIGNNITHYYRWQFSFTKFTEKAIET